MNAQIKKGILELVILNEIASRDLYGYELVKKLSEFYVDVDSSSYYTILRRLCRKEYLICYEGEGSGGPRRKYYHMTPEGSLYLEQRKKELLYMNQMNRKLGLA